MKQMHLLMVPFIIGAVLTFTSTCLNIYQMLIVHGVSFYLCMQGAGVCSCIVIRILQIIFVITMIVQ